MVDAFNKAGAEKIFVDRVSGAKADRPGLDQLLEIAPPATRSLSGNSILARSLEHLDDLRKKIRSPPDRFRFPHRRLRRTNKPAGKLSFHIVGAIAEFERDLIRARP